MENKNEVLEMKNGKKKLPIGVDDFEKLRTNNFYYVDKTSIISDLLNNGGEVNLFTRPRRFGKSLTMSMLNCFFSPGTDKSVFNGLKIMEDRELCQHYMGKYPTISISLKEVYSDSYESAYQAMASEIVRCAGNFLYLRSSKMLTPEDQAEYNALRQRNMDIQTLSESLLTLSRLLEKHHGQKVIILIDEYDVPLAKASEYGYYDQMILLIRKLLGYCLKSNTSLESAVLTGCMRISKESIFTGLNNLEVFSISDIYFEEYFGFTDSEVKEMLKYYGVSDRYGSVKEWYDGYLFGNLNVYCPWDVVNYCKLLLKEPDAEPRNYWVNSSGNEVVHRFIEHSENASVAEDIEKLVNGETVEKTIRQDLTYPELYSSIDNIWSVLFTTGYLTQKKRLGADRFRLVIPNQEIRYIFTTQISEMFRENVKKDSRTLDRFCNALECGDAAEVETCFNEYLSMTISIRDTSSPRNMKENFYHGVLLGILGCRSNKWITSSNLETGDGYCDITVRTRDLRTAILIEVKYAEDGNLDATCRKALKQISDRHYGEDLEKDYRQVLKYGLACYNKQCRVMIQS